MDIEDNEDVGLFWRPDQPASPANGQVFEKSDNEQSEEPAYGPVEVSTPDDTTILDDEKLKHQRAVRLTDLEDDWIATLMLALGTKNAGEAIRWCVKKAYIDYGVDVNEIAQKKAMVGSL